MQSAGKFPEKEEFKELENGWKRKNCRQSAGNVLDGINCVQCWKISEICKETEEQRAKC